ncbi:Hypothetical protein PHPALM_14859 [Phytophthora palmivora]|uniref:Uncharacterized protein n=1 Tax=Phytophthora palmivora TaxID=4796 RepID=A0A2P4XTN6_9STRA|nr:Hypothetical protein PHPALM_14859 [Phytophthora palmivora]
MVIDTILQETKSSCIWDTVSSINPFTQTKNRENETAASVTSLSIEGNSCSDTEEELIHANQLGGSSKAAVPKKEEYVKVVAKHSERKCPGVERGAVVSTY